MHENKLDQVVQKQKEKEAHREQRSTLIFRRILHFMERVIGAVTLLALLGNLILECFGILVYPALLLDLPHILHHLLGIVVGLEFVRMLIDTTPANISEVLVLAITRHVSLTHNNPWDNLLSLACIAGLFAIRRFLIRPQELREDLVEQE